MGQILSSNYVPLYDNNYKPAIRQLDTLDINVLYNIRYYCPVELKNNYDQMAPHKFESLPNYNNIGNYYGETLEIAAADKKQNKQRHGLGIQEYKDKVVGDNKFVRFIGNFEHDKIKGKGIYLLGGQSFIYGEFDERKLKGKGMLYVNENEKYIGEWVDGIQISGIQQNQYEIYVGPLVNGLKQGIGINSKLDGQEYFGSFESNNYQGYGEIKFGNGVTYKGDWQNNRRQGFGSETFFDEEYYGYFENDLKHGMGQQIIKQQQKIIKEGLFEFGQLGGFHSQQKDGAQREYKGLQDGGPEIIFNHFREIRSIEEIMNIQPNQRIEVKKKELQDKSRDLNQRKRALLEQKKQCFQYETKAYEHMKSLQSLVDYVQILFNFFFMIRLKLVIIDVMSH
ncbi:Phosphatidylinositol 4-phosphate 5-kinase type-1 beta [Paramecium bursaria]